MTLYTAVTQMDGINFVLTQLTYAIINANDTPVFSAVR